MGGRGEGGRGGEGKGEGGERGRGKGGGRQIGIGKIVSYLPIFLSKFSYILPVCLRADFREGDEDSNFSVLRIWRFTESSGPLH